MAAAFGDAATVAATPPPPTAEDEAVVAKTAGSTDAGGATAASTGPVPGGGLSNDESDDGRGGGRGPNAGRASAGSSVRPGIPCADVRDLLLAQCAGILKGVDCTFAGPASLLLVEGAVPPEVQLARRFGAAVRAEIGLQCTHILVPPALLQDGAILCERTNQLLRQARAHKRLGDIAVVDARWLLDCVSRWQRVEETDYTLDLSCLVQPMHIVARSVPTGNPYVAASQEPLSAPGATATAQTAAASAMPVAGAGASDVAAPATSPPQCAPAP